MAEKRVFKRLRRRLSIKFGLDEPARVAFTEDINDRGMFIKTTNIYPVGSRIKMEISLPGEEKVRITGSVRWSKKVPPAMIHLVRKAGMGVKFLSFESGEEAFRHFLHQAQSHREQSAPPA